MEQTIIEEIKNLGNPYEQLEIDYKNDIIPSFGQIKQKHKELSRKYHPDKTKGNEDMKLKYYIVQKAFDFLEDQVKKRVLDQYLKSKKEIQDRYFEQNSDRKSYYEDLLRREQEDQEKRRENIAKKFKDQMKQEENEQDRKKQEDLQKAQKQQEKEEKLKKKMMEDGFWSKINSIKIKWPQENCVFYNKKLIQRIFSEFGAIKKIENPENKKNKAVVEFQATHSCETAFNEFNKQNKDIFETIQVKYFLKDKKRKEMLQELHDKKRGVQTLSQKLELNSDNLNKLASIINRTSNSFIVENQNDHLYDEQRKQERQNLIDLLMKED